MQRRDLPALIPTPRTGLNPIAYHLTHTIDTLEGNRTRGSDPIPGVLQARRPSSFSVVWEIADI